LTSRIFLKLGAGVLAVLVLALLAVDILASRVAETSYYETQTRMLGEKARLIELLAKVDPSRARAIGVAAGARVTLIARDGSVIADSEADAGHMENHRDRPEVRAALGGAEGSSIRLSPTTNFQYLYVAIPVEQGALRLAVPLMEVKANVESIRRRMLGATALAFILPILIAAFFARSVSRRLGRIIEFAAQLSQANFTGPQLPDETDELGQLGSRLTETAGKLRGMVAALEREHAELEKVERVRKDFVINVSHELRTPLASIQGYTETLLDGAMHEPDLNVRFLTIIRKNAERLANLISDLLTLSRVELQQQKFHIASYRMDLLLADSVDSMMPMAVKKKIEIRIDSTPHHSDVFCDAEAVHQILTNLLDNALKYTSEGGTITVAAESSRNMVKVSVRDTGVGIPSEELPRLFERFYRVDKARSRELGGTGLGLAIVKHLTKSQGGEVEVWSEPGKGSVFSFTLPVADPGSLKNAGSRASLTVS
jgi:two-component system phosphate regulon sensor histidine kinase PhoR